jgi:hypothetical protein
VGAAHARRDAAAMTITLPSDGAIVVAGDDRWDAARRAWNLTVDQRPAGVAFPRDVADVQAALHHARERGLRVAAQSTGHGARTAGPLDGALLLRTGGLGELTIDPAARTARVGAGVLWAEVQEAAAEHGLTGLVGSAAHVGVVGYVLGGGLGWFGRSEGLACNAVRAFDVVLADGTACRADAAQRADLFWALRGAGRAPAIVTSVEIALRPIAEVQAGTLLWDVSYAGAVLHRWRDWVDTLPETATSVGRLQRFPPLPTVPEPLRGGSFVGVELCATEDAGTVAGWVAALTAGLPRPLGAIGALPPTRLPELHRDPIEPAPAASEHALLSDAPHEAIDRLVAVGGPESALVSVELRHLGGALGRAPEGAGALDRLDGRFLLNAIGILAGPGEAKARADLAALRAVAQPWAAPCALANFAGSPGELRRSVPPDVRARLDAAAERYDPAGLVR